MHSDTEPGDDAFAPEDDYRYPDSGQMLEDAGVLRNAITFTVAQRAYVADSLLHRPFDGMARRLGISVAELFSQARALQERGVMRRYSAVLHHRRAGFRANAMVVWRVPEERAQEVGMTMARSPWVTHCYQRPTFPDWPYTHFAMIHAQTRRECEEVARQLSQETGITDYRPLYSTREYKKTRVRYFVDEEATV